MELEKTYSLKELLQIVPLGRSTIYDLMSKDIFPKPIKIGPRFIRWRERDIIEWYKSQGIEQLKEVK